MSDIVSQALTQLGALFVLAAVVSWIRETHCRKELELELAETRQELKRATRPDGVTPDKLTRV